MSTQETPAEGEGTQTKGDETRQPETAAQPAAAPPAPSPPANGEKPDPEWLNPRLEQAKHSGQAELLRGLGVEKPEDLQAKLKRLEELENEKLSAEERRQKELDALKPKASRAEQLEATIKEHAARQMIALTEAQVEAVKKIAGDDPAAQLKAIDALQPTWIAQAQAAASNGGSEPSHKQTPKDTAPARTAPTDTATSPTDHRAVYRQLKTTNPFAAADYMDRHYTAIFGSES